MLRHIAVACAVVAVFFPAFATAGEEKAHCDADQMQQVVAVAYRAIDRRDWGKVLAAGATMRFAAQICREEEQKITAYMYGDYFLAVADRGLGNLKDAKKYADDGLAITKIADSYGAYTELSAKMRGRFRKLLESLPKR